MTDTTRNWRPGHPDAETARQHRLGQAWLAARREYLDELGRPPSTEELRAAEQHAYRLLAAYPAALIDSSPAAIRPDT